MKKTLKDLVAEFGSQEAAARECGVVLSTFNRWVRKKAWPPKGENTRRRLRELGVAV